MNDISYKEWASMSDDHMAQQIGQFVKHHRLEAATQRLVGRTSALSFRTGKAAEGCPVRNAAESFFFATFFFAEKKKVGAKAEKKKQTPNQKKKNRNRKIRRKVAAAVAEEEEIIVSGEIKTKYDFSDAATTDNY